MRVSLYLCIAATIVLGACGDEADQRHEQSEVNESPQGEPDGPDVRRPTDNIAFWYSSGQIDAQRLREWLIHRGYAGWSDSGAVRPTAEGGSKVYWNDAFFDALVDGTTPPADAMAVRELYHDDLLTPKATNIVIRLRPDGGDGSGMMWGEITDFSEQGDFSVLAPAATGCMACHGRSPTLTLSR